MQPCNRIYYSTVQWRLNMFRAAYRSSLGALTVCAASGLYTHVVAGCSQVWVGTAVPTQTWLRPITTCVCKPETAKTDLLMMSCVPLETCWAVTECWNNKFRYKVASCWLFILSHTTMQGSMNIKFINACCLEERCFSYITPSIPVKIYMMASWNSVTFCSSRLCEWHPSRLDSSLSPYLRHRIWQTVLQFV
jgi:hypothetical protein